MCIRVEFWAKVGWEQLTNERLCEILSDSKLDDQGKLDAIKVECDGKTKDNYTCWLIPVADVTKDGTDLMVEEDVIQAVSVDSEDHSSDITVQEVLSPMQSSDDVRRKKRIPIKKFLKLLLSVFLICACACAVWLYLEKDTNEEKPEIEQIDRVSS